jgi:hypothetical protein
MTIQNKLVQGGIWTDVAKQATIGDAATGLTAAGSTQATALAITSDISVFSTVGASTGAILPSTLGACDLVVFNGGANALAVYCPVGGTMNGTSNGSVSVSTTAKVARFVSADGLAWYSMVTA